MAYSLIALVSAQQALSVLPVPTDVEQLLSKMRSAYARVERASGEATIRYFGTLGMPGSGSGTTRRTSSFRFSSAPHLEVTVHYPGELSVFLATDGVRSTSVDLQGVVTKSPFEVERFSTIASTGVATLFLTWDRSLSTDIGGWMLGSNLRIERNVEWKGKRWLELIQERPSDNGMIAGYLIDPETMMVHRTRYGRRGGQAVLIAEADRLDVQMKSSEGPAGE